MSGWIRIQRDIFNHRRFVKKELCHLAAWQWLIANAVWKQTYHIVSGDEREVPRGSLYCTLRELAREWNWKSDYKVRSFLIGLEKDKMITQNGTQGKTHITICNYGLYQDVSQEENATSNAETNAKETQDKRTKETNKQNNTTILLDGREAEIYEALGENERHRANSCFLVLSEPINWLDSGCDFDLDILPTIQSLSARNPNIKSWSYFSNAVFEARDARLAPAPTGTNFPTTKPQSPKKLSASEVARQMANEARAMGQ